MSDIKPFEIEDDDIEDVLTGSSVDASSDVFEVVDVLVKEESADLEAETINDVLDSPPGPSNSAQDPAQEEPSDVDAVSSSFHCQKCGKTFRDLRRLRRHDRDVHALVRVQCERCSYTSARKDHLQRHYQCWHKMRWSPSMSWWKRVTQRNGSRTKSLYRPELIRRSSGSGGSVPRQRVSSSASRSSMPPSAISRRLGNSQGIPGGFPSMRSQAPNMMQSVRGQAPNMMQSVRGQGPNVSTQWTSLPAESSSGMLEGQVSFEAAQASTPSLTPPMTITSVRSLLQPSTSLCQPSAVSMGSTHHDPRSIAPNVPSTSSVTLLSARPTASVGNSPQIISLLQNASSGESLPTSSSVSAPAASSPTSPARALSMLPPASSSSLSAVTSSISPRSKKQDPNMVTHNSAALTSARPALASANPASACNTKRPAANAGESSSQIFSLLRNVNPASGRSGAVGSGNMVGPANNSPNVLKVQAQMTQNTSGSEPKNPAAPRNTPGSTSQSTGGLSQNLSSVRSQNSTGSVSQNPTSARNPENMRWATVEEKRTTRYFVEGRLIRQEEETVQSYKKIPAHWDLGGIDVRDNYPSNQ